MKRKQKVEAKSRLEKLSKKQKIGRKRKPKVEAKSRLEKLIKKQTRK